MVVPVSRPTIDTTNIVLDPPLATAPSVPKRVKPSAQVLGKSLVDPVDKQTLAERRARKRAEENAVKAKELEDAQLRLYAATQVI